MKTGGGIINISTDLMCTPLKISFVYAKISIMFFSDKQSKRTVALSVSFWCGIIRFVTLILVYCVPAFCLFSPLATGVFIKFSVQYSCCTYRRPVHRLHSLLLTLCHYSTLLTVFSVKEEKPLFAGVEPTPGPSSGVPDRRSSYTLHLGVLNPCSVKNKTQQIHDLILSLIHIWRCRRRG